MINGCEKHQMRFTTDKCPKCAEEEEKMASDPMEGVVVIGGLDLAKFHDYSALALVEVKDGIAVPKATKTWPHVDYQVVVRETMEIYRQRNLRMLAIDATGVGAPISEMFLARGVKTEDIKFGEYVIYTSPLGKREKAPIKFAMAEFARACLQEGKVKFPKKGVEDLIQQLQEQQLIVGPTDRPTYVHPQGKQDDLCWAFLMALYVARRWITGPGTWVYRIG